MPDDQPPTPRTGMLARVRGIVRGLGPAGPLLVLASGGPLLGFFVFTATYNSCLSCFGDDLPSALGFTVLGALLAAFCLIPTQLAAMVAGYLFGASTGTVVAFLIVLIAAAIGFLLWSRVVGTCVLESIAKSEQARQVHLALFGRSFWQTSWLIALLRLSPVMPFAATNLLMAALGIRLGAFLVATMIGVTPRLVAVSVIGAGLSEFDWSAGSNRWTTVMAIIATVLVLTMISRIAGRALQRVTDVS